MDDLEAPPSRRWALFAMILLCLGTVVGTSLFERREKRAGPAARAGGSWFDLDSAPESKDSDQFHYTPRQQPSSLGMVRAGPGFSLSEAPRPAPVAEKPAASPLEGTFTELCRGSEAKIEALARDYTRRYPVIAQYGKDWMSYPDLKKLNDDYMRDHDPVKFIRGLAGSKGFAAMFQRYAAEPVIQSFAMDSLRQAPPEAVASGAQFLSQDEAGRTLIPQFIQTMGLPPVVGDPTADQKAVMEWAAKNNPPAFAAKPRQDR